MEDHPQAGPRRRGEWCGYLLVLPGLAAVLGSWPRLAALSPIWLTVAVAAELASFTCHFAGQAWPRRPPGGGPG